MSEQPRDTNATVQEVAPPSADEIRQQFTAAWEEALRTGAQPPEIDSFHRDLASAELLPLRSELARIAQSYQERLSQTKLPQAPVALDPRTIGGFGDATVGTAPESDAAGATQAFAPSEIQGDDGPTKHAPDDAATEPPKEKVAVPQIAGYDLLGVLGRGGMGVVYKARQRGLKRLVALKMILSGSHASALDLARFKIEAEAVAQFQHPNIVQIYEIGDHDGMPFFSLEYVEGGSLAAKITGMPLPSREAAEVVRLMAQAMQYAHDKGIIHRDLKPANVLLTKDGQPKITDFGLAKRLDEDSGQTRHGSVLGTPSYMPPEQAEGRAADVGPLSDVYSLGAILYELLTGRAPFRAATVIETLTQVRRREPVSPVQLQPGTPRDLETICLKCLQKDPTKRYSSAGALADDLRRFLNNEPIKARPVPAYEHAWRWCRRNPVVAALSGAVALLILLALAGSVTAAIVINNEKNAKIQETIRANQEKDRANTEKDRANDLAKVAKANADLANRNAKIAVDRQASAVSHVITLGEQMQKQMRRKATSPQLEAELRPVRADMLAALRLNLLELAKEMEHTDLTSFSFVYTHQRLGDLFHDIGMGAEAREQYEIAHERTAKVVEDKPEDDKGRGNLAFLVAKLGDMELDQRGDVAGARKLFQKALDLQTDVEEHPRSGSYSHIDHLRLKADYLFKLANVNVRGGDPATARTQLEKCVANRRDWLKAEDRKRPRGLLAEACLWLADVCWRLGDAAAADKLFAEGIDHVQKLIAKDDEPDFKADLAESYLLYANALYRLGKYDEARHTVEKCPELLSVALKKDPESLRYQELAVRLRYAQGLNALRENDPPGAVLRFAEALPFSERLAAIDPDNLPPQVMLVACLARNGKAAAAAKKADDLRPRLAKDPDLLVRLAGGYALCAAAAKEDAAKKEYRDKALAILRAVTKDGYKDRVNLQTHPDLESLADDAAFKEIVAQAK